MITNNLTSFDASQITPKNWEYFLCILFVFAFPLSFLSVKHGVHVSLYGIFILYIYSLITGARATFINKKSIFIFISLSSLLIATAVQQIISSHINFSAWDGPSRLLIAGLSFLYLRQKNINYTKILEIAIPLGLILLCAYLNINQKYYWGARWANSYVDPNSLGSQTTILSMICLLSMTLSSTSYINILKILGTICGIYISIKAESRGGWISIPIMTLCWFIIQMKQTDFWLKKGEALKITGTLFILICSIIAITIFVGPVKKRLLDTIYEISAWFSNPTIYTSAGARMSIWVASLQLIGENFMGYGEIAIKEILAEHPLHQSIYLHGVKDMIVAGPHSDILSKGLSLGVLGIAAYLLTIFAPTILFASKIKSQDLAVRKSAHIGLMYVTGVFAVGLFNETLSLKYLCSFYGLMIACLTGQILYTSSTKKLKNLT